jgi:L-lactate dehydrogenase
MATERTVKVGIVGAGSVGATIAYAAMIRGVARQISLYDVAKSKVNAEVLDLNHGLMFVPMANIDGSDDIEVLSNSDVIVVTAGAKQNPGQTRIDLAQANADLCKKILPAVLRVAPQAILLMVTGLSQERVIGSGTVLDSSRFRYLLARHCNVAVQNVHAYIAGEHGDSEIPLWSSASIGNIPLSQWSVPGHGQLTEEIKQDIVRNVKEAAYQVIQGKGATNYAVGLAVTNILEAILHNEGRVLPVSSWINGYRGLSDVCLSMPRIVNRAGVEQPLPLPMTVDEEAGLRASAERISKIVRSLGF